MNSEHDTSGTDEYFVTALQIFEYCGGESTGTLRVDALMDKFAPFVKTDKAEFKQLRSLLDPDHCNPEISVTRLANSLHAYSESQKTKMDLDESFNLRCGQMPQDSDSGISTDGFQLLEELQSELREKAHLAATLRGRLDAADRHHEEALQALTAERDDLRAHLHVLREENASLSAARRDYEEAVERAEGAERALAEARRDLDAVRAKDRAREERLEELEIERQRLTELASQSTAECHRMNAMYAARQAALLEDNEALRAARADLAAKLADHDQFVQQIVNEKVLLEMELKEAVNKSNQTHSRLERSIDVSYTDDHMLTELDTLNADTRFEPENQILDEESFVNALRENQGRPTNLSLFDEIRLSFCLSKNNTGEILEPEESQEDTESSLTTIGTQTDEGFNENGGGDATRNACKPTQNEAKTKQIIATILMTISTQTDTKLFCKDVTIQTDWATLSTQETQTDDVVNNNEDTESRTCPECERLMSHTAKLEDDLLQSHTAISDLQLDLDNYEQNLTLLQAFLDEGADRNKLLQVVVDSMQAKLNILDAVCADQKGRIESLTCETCCAEMQTDWDHASISTQVDVPCFECEKRRAVVPQRSLRRYLWEPLKCLFQVFAVVCFICAVSVLYGVTRRWNARCDRDVATVPWRWFDAQDVLDLLLRIEYVADVPM